MRKRLQSRVQARVVSALILAALSLWSLAGPEVPASAATALNNHAATALNNHIASQPAQPSTIVSLTFDDGYSSQWAARDILREHHARGTFYIPSGFIGLDGRMASEQLRLLQADGNEIGGHTVNHPNLPTVDDAEQRRQICDDRVALSQYGFRVTSFAYPFGALDTRVEAAARSCGYNSARADGGLDPTAAPCVACPFAEKVPPADPYSVRTASPVVTTTTLELAEQHIVQAETHGGGWVPLVFHDVCDHCSDQDISPETLSGLLTWLESRTAKGTVIETVDQVMGGASKPGVKGPPDQRPAAELVNASLENPGRGPAAAGKEASYCWEQSGYGSNTASWARVPTAHSGRWAEQVSIKNYQSGDQKLLTKEDSGTCSPTVTPGKAYNLSAWYTSTAPTRLVVFYRTVRGNWLYLNDSPEQPASAIWRNASWITPELPPDATRISYGLQLATNGTLTTDDYAMSEQKPPLPFLAILLIAVGIIGLVPTVTYVSWSFYKARSRSRAQLGGG